MKTFYNMRNFGASIAVIIGISSYAQLTNAANAADTDYETTSEAGVEVIENKVTGGADEKKSGAVGVRTKSGKTRALFQKHRTFLDDFLAYVYDFDCMNGDVECDDSQYDKRHPELAKIIGDDIECGAESFADSTPLPKSLYFGNVFTIKEVVGAYFEPYKKAGFANAEESAKFESTVLAGDSYEVEQVVERINARNDLGNSLQEGKDIFKDNCAAIIQVLKNLEKEYARVDYLIELQKRPKTSNEVNAEVLAPRDVEKDGVAGVILKDDIPEEVYAKAGIDKAKFDSLFNAGTLSELHIIEESDEDDCRVINRLAHYKSGIKSQFEKILERIAVMRGLSLLEIYTIYNNGDIANVCKMDIVDSLEE